MNTAIASGIVYAAILIFGLLTGRPGIAILAVCLSFGLIVIWDMFNRKCSCENCQGEARAAGLAGKERAEESQHVMMEKQRIRIAYGRDCMEGAIQAGWQNGAIQNNEDIRDIALGFMVWFTVNEISRIVDTEENHEELYDELYCMLCEHVGLSIDMLRFDAGLPPLDEYDIDLEDDEDLEKSS